MQSNVQALQILLSHSQFCPVMCIVHVQAFLSLFGHYCKIAHITMFLQCRIRRYVAMYSIGHWLNVFYVTHPYCAIDKPALMQRFPLYSLYQTQPHTRYCDDSKKAVAALPQEELAHYRLPREFQNFSVKPRWRTVVKHRQNVGKPSFCKLTM